MFLFPASLVRYPRRKFQSSTGGDFRYVGIQYVLWLWFVASVLATSVLATQNLGQPVYEAS